MKKPIEPSRCVCGRTASWGDQDRAVRCNDKGGNCWIGPCKPTMAVAVRAWNRVMKGAVLEQEWERNERKSLREHAAKKAKEKT